MEVYDDLRQGRPAGSSNPGLVLLYAPDFASLQPAYPLRQREVVIGREPPAQVVIPLPAVSRSHARLFHDGTGWQVGDLGARNGTLLNGAFIQQSPIAHNDEVRIGDAFFKFVERDCESYQPYRIDGAVFGAPATPSGIVGGHQLAAIATALERIAKSMISVVVLGESGTGKEIFARQVHAWSGRAGAFCALNCAAIPATLLESELFGYRRGAFSGADRDHVGLVRTADRGTLFLDEVGDMPLEAQAKLLRVLQTKEVMPLGATAPEQVDVRIVCATHQDLNAMLAARSFRGDLFARLNEYAITLPPLRERKEDIYALCLEFLRLHKRPDLVLTVPYMTGLLHWHFPYNVRELEALIKRGIALCEGSSLDSAHLSAEVHNVMQHYGRAAGATPTGAPPEPLPQQRPPSPSWHPPAHAEPAAAPESSTAAAAIPQAVGAQVPGEDELRRVLAATGGNVAAVGRHYGKERMQVHRWMRKYNIDPNEYRP
ncbi:MAG: sigma 54-interacting transcriptional regulator [Deltaproteobacteria bacterium]|nr:sigma 54-interacting transcriptional regulator [Deltaproteobacteria bacterium]